MEELIEMGISNFKCAYKCFIVPGIPETLEHKIGTKRESLSNATWFRYLCDVSGY